MYYSKYQRMSPDIQTEWGTYTNPRLLVQPDQMKFRQPGPPMIARGYHDFIHPHPPQGLPMGYYTEMGQAAPPGAQNEMLKNLLILAGIVLLIYWLTRPGGEGETKSNPAEPRPRRCGFTKDGLKRLRESGRRTASRRKRDPETGRFR